MIQSTIAALPNLVLTLIVFVLFYFVTKGVKAAVNHTLTVNGIDLPFPTQQTLFHDQTEETDGDRSRQREGWPAGKDEVPQPRGIAGALHRLTRLPGSQEATDHSHRPQNGQ